MVLTIRHPPLRVPRAMAAWSVALSSAAMGRGAGRSNPERGRVAKFRPTPSKIRFAVRPRQDDFGRRAAALQQQQQLPRQQQHREQHQQQRQQQTFLPAAQVRDGQGKEVAKIHLLFVRAYAYFPLKHCKNIKRYCVPPGLTLTTTRTTTK